MKLSKLAFNCVKGVKIMDNTEFNYESFKQGFFDNDTDYSALIVNVFSSISKAIHRLSDRNKLPTKIKLANKNTNTNIIDLPLNEINAKSIQNVFSLDDYGNHLHYAFREMGKEKIIVKGVICPDQVYVEYFEDIPIFSRADYYYEDGEEPLDIDLSLYGINDTMCSYIEEYVKGELFETISPELANLHLSRAEQYFADLDDFSTNFNQEVIKNKYRIGI